MRRRDTKRGARAPTDQTLHSTKKRPALAPQQPADSRGGAENTHDTPPRRTPRYPQSEALATRQRTQQNDVIATQGSGPQINKNRQNNDQMSSKHTATEETPRQPPTITESKKPR